MLSHIHESILIFIMLKNRAPVLCPATCNSHKKTKIVFWKKKKHGNHPDRFFKQPMNLCPLPLFSRKMFFLFCVLCIFLALSVVYVFSVHDLIGNIISSHRVQIKAKHATKDCLRVKMKKRWESCLPNEVKRKFVSVSRKQFFLF